MDDMKNTMHLACQKYLSDMLDIVDKIFKEVIYTVIVNLRNTFCSNILYLTNHLNKKETYLPLGLGYI